MKLLQDFENTGSQDGKAYGLLEILGNQIGLLFNIATRIYDWSESQPSKELAMEATSDLRSVIRSPLRASDWSLRSKPYLRLAQPKKGATPKGSGQGNSELNCSFVAGASCWPKRLSSWHRQQKFLKTLDCYLGKK